MAHLEGKKCKNGIPNAGKLSKCKLQCKFDKKDRTKDLPRIINLECIPAVNDNGETIGSELKYTASYERYNNMCGKGIKRNFILLLKNKQFFILRL